MKRKETVLFYFAKNNVKSVARRDVIISLIERIFLQKLTYYLRICWIILTKIIVCVSRLCAEL